MLSTATNSPRAYPTMVSGFSDVLAQEGPRGLMRGLVPAMFGVSHGALQFMFYESLKEWRFHRSGEKELGTGDWLVLSATAKLATGALTYPYKVVQTRMQDFGGGGKGPVEVCKGILWGEGLRGFYKG
jgi:solute carrier family 25 folate transporter 32